MTNLCSTKSALERFRYRAPVGTHGRGRQRTEWIELQFADAEDHTGDVIRATRTFYEIDLLEHLARRGPIGGVFIDVGANIGNHSVYFGKYLADHVVSVEPSRRLAEILRCNLEGNGVGNALILNAGLHARAGTAKVISPARESRNPGLTRLEIFSDDGSIAPVRPPPIAARWMGHPRPPQIDDDEVVTVMTLEEVARDIRLQVGMGVTLVKIDVEGAELDVLRGGVGLLGAEHPQLIVELATESQRKEAAAWLAEFGYEAVGQFCRTPTFHFVDRRFHRLREDDARARQGWTGKLGQVVRRAMSPLNAKARAIGEASWRVSIHPSPIPGRSDVYVAGAPTQPAFQSREYWEARHRKLAGSLRATGHILLDEADNLADVDARCSHIVAAIGRHTPQAANVRLLDAGCGTGIMSERFGAMGWDVVGLDFSAQAIEQARVRCPDVEFHVTSLDRANLKQRFDVVTAIEVLLHVVDEECWRRTLQALIHHVDHDGIIVIIDTLQAPDAMAVEHVRHRTVTCYERALGEMGFSIHEHSRFDLPGEKVTKDLIVARRVR